MKIAGEIEEQYGEKGAEVAIWRPVGLEVPMDVMVEWVARAMFARHHESRGLPVSEQAWEVTGPSWRECAQTAINTLSRPPKLPGAGT